MKDTARRPIRRLFSENPDQYCSANRVAHQNGAAIELRELFLESRLPARELWIRFMGMRG